MCACVCVCVYASHTISAGLRWRWVWHEAFNICAHLLRYISTIWCTRVCVSIHMYMFRCQHDTHLKLLHPCVWGGFDAALPNDSILTSASAFPLAFINLPHPFVPTSSIHLPWIYVCFVISPLRARTPISYSGNSIQPSIFWYTQTAEDLCYATSCVYTVQYTYYLD